MGVKCNRRVVVVFMTYREGSGAMQMREAFTASARASASYSG
jgi:hypothetical protein